MNGALPNYFPTFADLMMANEHYCKTQNTEEAQVDVLLAFLKSIKRIA